MAEHYRWDARGQRRRPDGAEVAMVGGVTALLVSPVALALLFAR